MNEPTNTRFEINISRIADCEAAEFAEFIHSAELRRAKLIRLKYHFFKRPLTMEAMENVDLSDIPAPSKVTTPTDPDPLDQPDDQSTYEGLAPAHRAIPLWAISSEIHGVMQVKESADWQKKLVDELADSSDKSDNMRLFCFRWGVHMGIIAVIALILLIYFSFISSTSPVVTVSSASKDCFDLYHRESEIYNGIYTIFPSENGTSFQVYCDMITDGGGWTVFQRRVDHRLVFWNKSWVEYEHGFNNGLDRDYWLGLDRLHTLTNKDENVILRIDIWGDRCILEPATNFDNEARNCSQTENGYWFGEWTFQVGNESDGYLLKLRRNAGNLTSDDESDYFQSINEMMFSTIDNDNDMESERNCALDAKLGGWWHRNCTSSSLNGDYYIDELGYSGFRWRQKQADGIFSWIYPLMSEMKLRKINTGPPSEAIDLLD